ncbi:MAG TPA: SIR2 family protein [Actinophytocola sp.]|uniref:SIR2 family protein n=1 Tax=Actinophytocola sp. TaxID=1872138 RepID=UPI002DDCEE75|nr:SIR2 family protein [Actinophytocola sp.]HEV2784235.1 SIR2 family protein [Actinophytocola sp.]
MPGSGKPYFDRDDTLERIEQIAEKQKVVVYAGSGVSIDKTNLTWSGLVDKLMASRVQNHVVHEVIKPASPLEAASIVKQMYEDEFGANNANGEIIGDLRRILYPGQLWRQAEFPQAVMKLIAELNDSGVDYHVLTTNYDDFLEKQQRLLDADREDRGRDRLPLSTTTIDYDVDLTDRDAFDAQVRRFARCDHDAAAGPRGHRLVHLHGYVPQDPTVTVGSVTLSEVDYAESYRLSAAVLEALLREHSLLIVGSSLTDPPLLNALARTRNEAADNRLLRLAVMPMQAFELPAEDSDTVAAAVQKNIGDRMAHFRVKVTFPDFYAQATQFMTETRIAVAEHRAGRRYKGSAVQHGRRLRSWWETWSETRSENWGAANQRCHERLRDHLKNLQERFELTNEPMKLELWIRWEPQTNHRQFKLWAASTGTWWNKDSMRVSDIVSPLNGLPPALATFCRGRPEIKEPPGDRWRTHLCVPVCTGERDGQELPVAVISLASMDSATRIRQNQAASVSDITEALARIGSELVSADPFGS